MTLKQVAPKTMWEVKHKVALTLSDKAAASCRAAKSVFISGE